MIVCVKQDDSQLPDADPILNVSSRKVFRMKAKLIFVLLIISTSCVRAQIDTNIINRGLRIVAQSDSVGWEGLRTLKYLISHDKFAKEINSPLSKTKFLLYTKMWEDPWLYSVVTLYNDTMRLLPHKESWDGLIDFLNQRLEQENELQSDGLLRLIKCMTELYSVERGDNRIISDCNDIRWDACNTEDTKLPIPDTLKTFLHPPTVFAKSEEQIVEYFVWEGPLRMLSKITLTYSHRQLRFQKVDIGKYGRSCPEM